MYSYGNKLLTISRYLVHTYIHTYIHTCTKTHNIYIDTYIFT
jgi:hypothetical protein